VSAFYRGMPGCQPLISRKALVLQSLSSPSRWLKGVGASLAVASSSIGT